MKALLRWDKSFTRGPRDNRGMRLKLSDVEVERIRQAYNLSQMVLAAVKRKPLKGEALEEMKTLENAVQCLEIMLLGR